MKENFTVDDRPGRVPLHQSATAEVILKYLWLAIAMSIASVFAGIGAAWFFHTLDYLNLIPLGLMGSGLILFLLIFRDFLAHMDLHPWSFVKGLIRHAPWLSRALDDLDGRRNGKLFNLPLADEFTDEAPTEVDLERRVRRAIKAVTEMGVKATRDEICTRQKMMSQREWYFWHIRMIKSGIINEQHSILVPSTEAANAAWDAWAKKCGVPNRTINVGEGKKSSLVRASDLMNKKYVGED